MGTINRRNICQLSQDVVNRTEEIRNYAFDRGIELFGVASAKEYERRFPDKPSPRKLVFDARSIIVVGLPYEPGTMATVLRSDLEDEFDENGRENGSMGASAQSRTWFSVEEKLVIYRELDLTGYRIAKILRRGGWTALHLPPNKKDTHHLTAPFYHMPALYLAGLGTMGLNCCIINPEFGPRFIVTSIITNCELVANGPVDTEFCTKCGLCAKSCPINAIDGKGWKNTFACQAFGCCGTCIAVCPIGTVKVPRK